jgi:DNA-binding CsgD family transcriptional regulator
MPQNERRSGDAQTRGAGHAWQDAKWLSDTIGAIYDCALEPSRWEATIGRLAEGFGFASGVLAVLQLRQFTQSIKIHYRMDDEWIAAGDTYIEESVALWGGPLRVQSYPLDEPIVASDVWPAGEWDRFRYYREILGPRGLTDATVVALAREPQLVGFFGLNRVGSHRVERHEVEGLRLVTPHLRRAVTISNLFDLKAVEAKTFGGVLDGLTYAVFLVDENLHVVHANRAAETMLAAGDPILSFHGRLMVRGEIAANALEAAVRLAATDEVALGQRGIGTPARGKDGSPAVLHVMPLQRREIRSGLVQRAVAAVFVVDGTGTTYSANDAIAALYDFTPAESRIFALLGQNRSLAEAAEALGIAKSTARTHLLRVFAKTGCRRQAELVALGANLSLKF